MKCSIYSKSQKADKFDEEVYRNVQRDIASVSSNVSNSIGRLKVM